VSDWIDDFIRLEAAVELLRDKVLAVFPVPVLYEYHFSHLSRAFGSHNEPTQIFF